METDLKNFSYLIKMNIGPKKINIIVKNSKKVPEVFLETMAKEKIQKIYKRILFDSKTLQSPNKRTILK